MDQQLDIDAGRFWAAGLVASLIAALCGLITYLFATSVADETLFVKDFPAGTDLIQLTGGRVMIVGVIVGLIATGVLHLMMLFVPRPGMFFAVLSLAVLAASVLMPLSLNIETAAQWWLVGVNVTIGFVLLLLLDSVVPMVAVKKAPAPEPYYDSGPEIGAPGSYPPQQPPPTYAPPPAQPGAYAPPPAQPPPAAYPPQQPPPAQAAPPPAPTNPPQTPPEGGAGSWPPPR